VVADLRDHRPSAYGFQPFNTRSPLKDDSFDKHLKGDIGTFEQPGVYNIAMSLLSKATKYCGALVLGA